MSVQWFWKSDTNWIQYLDSDTLEKEYQNNPKAIYFLKINENTYIIDFSQMTQTNLKTNLTRYIKRVDSKSKNSYQWEWESDLGFVPFDQTIQDTIEKEYKTPTTSNIIKITIGSTPYIIDLVKFVQINTLSNKLRCIQRVEGNNIVPLKKYNISQPSFPQFNFNSSYLHQTFPSQIPFQSDDELDLNLNENGLKNYIHYMPQNRKTIICKNLLEFFKDENVEDLLHEFIKEEEEISLEKSLLKQIETYINVYQGEKKLIEFKNNKKLSFYFNIDGKPFTFKIENVFDVNLLNIESDHKELSEWNQNMNKIIQHKKEISPILLFTIGSQLYRELYNLEEIKVNKKLEDKYNDMWKFVSKEESILLQGTSNYLLKQIEKLKKNGLSGNPDSDINIRTMIDNPYHWTIFIKYSEDNMFGKYLKKYGEKYEKDPVVIIEILFTSYFPNEDPIIRLVTPRLQYATGGINHQGIFDISLVKNLKTKGKLKICDFIKNLKNYLTDYRAKINLNIEKPYEKLNPRQKVNNEFETTEKDFYHAFSSQFGEKVLNIPTNFKVEAANNILLPIDTFEKYFGSSGYKPGYCPTIQVKTSKGVYQCGVLSCETPKSVAIFPNWMFKDMLIEEGSKIEIQKTDLERGKKAKFRPLSSDFWKDTNGIQNFENSLSKFSCLTLGQMVQIQNSNGAYLFEVVALEPSFSVNINNEVGQHMDLIIGFEESIESNEKEISQIQDTIKSFKVVSPEKKLDFNPIPKDKTDIDSFKKFLKEFKSETPEFQKKDFKEKKGSKEKYFKEKKDFKGKKDSKEKKKFFGDKEFEKIEIDDFKEDIFECIYCGKNLRKTKMIIHIQTDHPEDKEGFVDLLKSLN